MDFTNATPTMLVTTSPEHLFTSNFRWYARDDGNFTAAALTRTYDVSRQALTFVHPLLPLALEAKLDYLHANDDKSRVFGDEMHWISTYLRHGAMRFVDVTGKDLYVPIIYDLSDVEGEDGVVVMECWDFHVSPIALDNGSEQVSVPLITAGEHCTTRLLKRDIEQLYPGWETRMVVAEEMDIEHDDLMSYIFHRAPEHIMDAQVGLPDINL